MTDTNKKSPTGKPNSSSEFEYQRNKAEERAKFLNDRQAKIDEAEKGGGADGNERGTVQSQYANPPSVRATDGGEPGTKERHPLEVAAELENEEAEQTAE